jgi:hypothetical protein
VRNDQPILATVARRLPVAVAAQAPVAVEVDPPQAPLVRGGLLGVNVRVRRAEGFAGELRVRALWTPAGIAAGQVAVAAAAEGGVLPLEASEGGALGSFPLAVAVGGGPREDPFEVVSAFVAVEVEKPWITAKTARARTTAGAPVDVAVALAPARALAAPYRARLLGLPKGVAAEPIEVAADASEATFHLAVAEGAAVGRHRDLRLELLLPHGGAEVVHRFPAAELRIDAPPAPPGAEAGR